MKEIVQCIVSKFSFYRAIVPSSGMCHANVKKDCTNSFLLDSFTYKLYGCTYLFYLKEVAFSEEKIIVTTKYIVKITLISLPF